MQKINVKYKVIFSIVYIITAFFAIAIMYLFCRVYVFDIYSIPTSSMEPTLIPGDRVYVNKLLLGARIYNSLDSIFSKKPEIHRIIGIRDVRVNDIIVFNFPFANTWLNMEFNINSVHCKRCIGIPKDTITIVNGICYNSSSNGSIGYVDSQEMISNILSLEQDRSFPYNLEWTRRDFGPLYIPCKEDVVCIDTVSYYLYRHIIEYETSKKLYNNSSIITLGTDTITHYKFKDNYFFVVGDNMINSQDSRSWGLLPESFVVGIVTHIVYSKDSKNNKCITNRVFKNVYD